MTRGTFVRSCIALVLIAAFTPMIVAQPPCDAIPPGAEPCCTVECCECCPSTCYYTRAEYLHWRPRGYDSPPIIVELPRPTKLFIGPPGYIGVGFASINGEGPITHVGGEFEQGGLSGARLTLGKWLDVEHTVAIEASGFWLPEDEFDLRVPNPMAPDSGGPHLTYGYRSVEDNILFIRPPLIRNARVRGGTETGGLELNAVRALPGPCTWRTDLLTGFRYFRLREDLEISADFAGRRFLGVERTDARRIGLVDEFETTNDFFAGQVGLQVQCRHDCWFAELRGKLALGLMRQQVGIHGSTTLETTGGVSEAASGARFAQDSNIGDHTRHVFAVMPEVGMNVGWDVTPALRITAGYTLLYFRDNVVRPGAQIDTRVNMTQAPIHTSGAPIGELLPGVLFRDSKFWLHGVSLGVELSF